MADQYMQLEVFVSWSGAASKHVAAGLYDWLPDVLHNVKPWISSESISAGARWPLELAERLSEINYGISCITPQNTTAPWLLYEAGALSKSIRGSRLATFLIGMTPEDLPAGPLQPFFHSEANKEGAFRIIKSINETLPTGLPAERLQRQFDLHWPRLEGIISSIPTEKSKARLEPSIDQKLDMMMFELRSWGSRLSAMSPPQAGPGFGADTRVFTMLSRIKNSISSKLAEEGHLVSGINGHPRGEVVRINLNYKGRELSNVLLVSDINLFDPNANEQVIVPNFVEAFKRQIALVDKEKAGS